MARFLLTTSLTDVLGYDDIDTPHADVYSVGDTDFGRHHFKFRWACRLKPALRTQLYEYQKGNSALFRRAEVFFVTQCAGDFAFEFGNLLQAAGVTTFFEWRLQPDPNYLIGKLITKLVC